MFGEDYMVWQAEQRMLTELVAWRDEIGWERLACLLNIQTRRLNKAMSGDTDWFGHA